MKTFTNKVHVSQTGKWGRIRLTQIGSDVWISLADFSRITGVSVSVLDGEIPNKEKAKSRRGEKFLQLSEATIGIAHEDEQAAMFLQLITKTRGLIGPSPNRLHPGPHPIKFKTSSFPGDCSFTMRARDVYRISRPRIPDTYTKWLREIEAADRKHFPSDKPGHSAFKNERLPDASICAEIWSTPNRRGRALLQLILDEARNGWHTQESLDEALGMCTRILPLIDGQIDARALHDFLEVPESFPLWFNECIFRDEAILGKHYQTPDGTPYLPTSSTDGSSSNPMVTVGYSKKLIDRTRTPRAASLATLPPWGKCTFSDEYE